MWSICGFNGINHGNLNSSNSNSPNKLRLRPLKLLSFWMFTTPCLFGARLVYVYVKRKPWSLHENGLGFHPHLQVHDVYSRYHDIAGTSSVVTGIGMVNAISIGRTVLQSFCGLNHTIIHSIKWFNSQKIQMIRRNVGDTIIPWLYSINGVSHIMFSRDDPIPFC